MKNITGLLLCLTIFNTTLSESNDSMPHNTQLLKNRLIELSSGYIIARAIHIAAQLHIADQLIGGPKTVTNIADNLNLHVDSLRRLIRLLASYDIFHEHNDTISLTPLAELLTSPNSNSLQPWIAHHHNAQRWAAYSVMPTTIQTGISSFEAMFHENFFNFIEKDDVLNSQFYEGMRNIASDENAIIAQSYDFSHCTLVIDIGSGTGELLMEIVRRNRTIKGIFFDLPATHEYVQKYTAKNTNLTFSPSTGFFEPIPSGADIYTLKRILHDWNDQHCIEILKKCCSAMPQHARLLIIECVVSDDNIRDFAKDVDIEMMVLFGGKERTRQDWETLVAAAGCEITTIFPTNSLLSIIEIKKQE